MSTIGEQTITLAVTRAYKNAEGEYDKDLITIQVSGNMMDNFKSYCNTGDIVGVKGVLENTNNELILQASKVTFLSSTKN